jgi:DNA polymerase III epsilon subunit-like protein
MAIITIDFEASCLPRHGRSYPIEVGIADAGGRSQSWLICPHRSWDGWDWTDEAQGLHGLTHERLLREGLPAAAVAAQLGKVLAGHRVIADSTIDAYWYATLAKAANVLPSAEIEYIGALFDALGTTSSDILLAQTQVDRMGFRRHRAGEDARWLFALIQTLTNLSASRAHAA